MTSFLGQAVQAVDFNLNRLSDRVLDARTDHVLFDFARVLCTQYAKVVEKFSLAEGNPVSAHNNKTLFLEAIDLWGRKRLGAGQKPMPGAKRIEDPRDAVVHVMEPWYESLNLEDPSKYRLTRREPPPVYVGDPADATALVMGLAACLDVTPMRFAFGGRRGSDLGRGNDQEVYQRIWAKVKADGTWYDSDIMSPGALGQRPDFPHYKEVEVGL